MQTIKLLIQSCAYVNVLHFHFENLKSHSESTNLSPEIRFSVQTVLPAYIRAKFIVLCFMVLFVHISKYFTSNRYSTCLI